jgi:hypothetical protein
MDQGDTSVYRRFPEPLAPAVGRRLARVRELAGYAVVTLLAWTTACARVARLRLESRRLLRLRRRAQLQLGGATYAGDAEAAAALVERMRALDARLAACVGETARTVTAARSEVAAERLAVARTQVHRAVR